MIVRILGEGQFELDEASADQLIVLDDPLEQALQAGDEAAFAQALESIEAFVRKNGVGVDPTTIRPSDLVLPAPGSDLNEVRALLESEGQGV